MGGLIVKLENNNSDDIYSEKLERRVYLNLLYDFYSPLLTERQRNVYEMLFFSDMASTEAARALGVSRQAVHILKQRIIKRLETIETRLHFAESSRKLEAKIKELELENASLKNEVEILKFKFKN